MLRQATFENVRDVFFGHSVYALCYKRVVRQARSIALSVLNRFSHIIVSLDFGKFAIKLTLKIPLHPRCVAALPCENILVVVLSLIVVLFRVTTCLENWFMLRNTTAVRDFREKIPKTFLKLQQLAFWYRLLSTFCQAC